MTTPNLITQAELDGELPELLFDEKYCCKRFIRSKGRHCRKPALKGSDFCQLHGGRHKGHVRLTGLPMFYSKNLTGTLKEAVEAALEVNPDEQTSLLEELAIMRHSAGQAVAMYNAALTLEGDEAANTLAVATELMRDALSHVAKMAKDAATVKAAGKDQFSIVDLKHIINQIVRIAYKAFGECDEVLVFEQMIADEIKVGNNAQGTTLTPDQTVLDMDDTIGKPDDQSE